MHIRHIAVGFSRDIGMRSNYCQPLFVSVDIVEEYRYASLGFTNRSESLYFHAFKTGFTDIHFRRTKGVA